MRRKRKRNPDAPPQRSLGGLKNWLILGGFIAGGYYVFKYFQSPGAAVVKSEIATAVSKAGAASTVAPDLNGPLVSKFMSTSAPSAACISTQLPGFIYAPVLSYSPITGYNFTATANGRFTRRMLCKGNQRWAEIRPS